MGSLRDDLRDVIRGWRRRPGFALAAVVSMALGIGANTAIFSVLHGVLLEPLPFADPARIYTIHSRHSSTDRYPFQLAEFCDHRDRNHTLQSMAAYASWSANLTGAGDAERIQGARVTGNLFDLLGARAALGRALAPADDEPSAERVVVLSHGLWERRFGGDPSILGRPLTFNGDPYTVVGVLPSGFLFPQRGAEAVVALKPEADPWRHNRDATSFLRVLARSRPGVETADIQADLDAISARLQKEFPSSYARKIGVLVVPWAEEMVRGVGPTLWMLQGGVALLLVITCSNVASLMLARSLSLRRDFAVRRALGASSARIVARLLAEGVILSLAGGAAGVLGALWGVPALLALAPATLPRSESIAIRPAVLIFTLAVSVVAGLAASLFPAWRSSRGDFLEDLGAEGRAVGSGRRASRLRWILITAEVGLLAVLLSGAGLLLRSFQAAGRVSPGFDGGTLTVRLSLPRGRYGTLDKVVAFYRELEARVAALPGVTEVAAVNHVPLNGSLASADYRTPEMPGGEDANLPTADYRMATPRYFEAMGIRLLAGRAFTESDVETAPRVAIVTRNLAQKSFPGKDAVGQTILVNDSPDGFREMEIVGVAGDLRHESLETEPSPHLFVPYAQTHPQLLVWLTATQFLVVRASVDPHSLEGAIRGALREVDPDVAASQVRTTGDLMEASVAPRRFSLTLMGLFAAVATVMAGIGLNGVVSTSVGSRRREMALRMALGARPSQVRGLVLRQAAAFTIAGAAAGLAVSLACGRFLQGLLFGVAPADLASHAAAIGILGAVVLAACDAPARRAARIAPAESLKSE